MSAAAGLLEAAPLLALLFVEELGVPLPMFPADGLLVAAGILAATGAVPLWVLLPALAGVDVLGASAGYLWSRAVRRRALARWRRLERTPGLRTLGERLRRTGMFGVFLTRLLPGLRVWTTLAAGTADLPARAYLAGMVPASLVWVTVVTLLGTLLGSRALPLLARFQGWGGEALVIAAAVLAGYLAARFMPAPWRRRSRPLTPGAARLVLGLALDVGIVVAAAALLAALALGPLNLGEPDGVSDVAVLGGVVGLLYVAGTRLGLGSTTGERLLRVDYRRR